ncbi:MAG: endonuclease domain-containing protein [Alphaproteobacteria bacterium]|nr:endonuclease domain-containing protein [Alphaproteobacteria bacterium]
MASIRARRLRQNPTKAEIRLWSRLRRTQLGGSRFRRQQPIGPYIVDFFCPAAKLIVEVDGGHHADDGPERTRWLESRGYRVIRFWNNEVLENTEGVILAIVGALPPPPADACASAASPSRGEAAQPGTVAKARQSRRGLDR